MERVWIEPDGAKGEGCSYFKMLATSMMSGISSEKPAELRVR